MEEQEGVIEGRQANEMGFTDEGRHGQEERRETSKDFNVTAFHTDNSALASPSVHVGQHAHTYAHKHMHSTDGRRAGQSGVACSCITLACEWRWVLTLQPPHANLAVNTNILTG